MKLEANLFSLIFLAVWPYLVGSAGGSWVWCQRFGANFCVATAKKWKPPSTVSVCTMYRKEDTDTVDDGRPEVNLTVLCVRPGDELTVPTVGLMILTHDKTEPFNPTSQQRQHN